MNPALQEAATQSQLLTLSDRLVISSARALFSHVQLDFRNDSVSMLVEVNNINVTDRIDSISQHHHTATTTERT